MSEFVVNRQFTVEKIVSVDDDEETIKNLFGHMMI